MVLDGIGWNYLLNVKNTNSNVGGQKSEEIMTGNEDDDGVDVRVLGKT